MKKGPCILLVMAMCLTMSVAANSPPPRTEVCVVDNVGDTKVVKASEMVDVITLRAGYDLQVAVDIALTSECLTPIDYAPNNADYCEVKVEKKEKIYLLNCSIRQCTGRSVATA